MDRFVDRVIVITGGGAGLGRECAKWWAGEGGRIVVTDLVEQRTHDVAKEITDKGGQAIARKADVRVESEVEAAVKAAVDEWGRLDIMFANAGVTVEGFGAIGFEDVTQEQWDDVNNVCCRGVFFAGKYACRQFKAQGGGGNIVVTTSAGGLNAYPGFGPYCAAKAGAIGLVRSMAYDWGRFGIRVNGLAPVHGMSVNFALPPDAEVVGLSYEEAALAEGGGEWDAATMFPGPLKVGRPPRLRDNAAVATFLASDDSEYMSGVTIPSCDGGNFARTSIPIPENWSLEDQVQEGSPAAGAGL
jgi:NAD(P)-dependent dehydrogenase (short-subunit alcohol dehydrogenase family)